MTLPKLDCNLDKDGNPVLFEIDAAGIKRKVATLLPDGSIRFESSYENRSEAEKEAFEKAIKNCPRSK